MTEYLETFCHCVSMNPASINTSRYFVIFLTFKMHQRASLVAQWLGICLPMQGTRVRALVWEDPTCHGATGPMSHNY